MRGGRRGLDNLKLANCRVTVPLILKWDDEDHVSL